MKEGEVMDLYYKEVIGIIDEIRATEKEHILQAAHMIADQVAQDKLVYVFGPGGHSNLAAMEVFFRAGGLMHISAILNQETMLSSGALKSMQTERLPGYGSIVINDYGIGKDRKIALCVEEKNRSWCSSSSANDQRAVTIECASDLNAPYAMTTAVYNSLVKLCTDICKRNGKKKLLVDCHVDCKVKLGDATIKLEGFEQKIGALSTYANAYVMNSIVVEAINILVNKGINPPVWRSGNCPGGDEWNNQFIERFRGSVRCL